MTFNNVLLIGTQQTHFDTVKMYRRPPLQSIRRGISTTQLVFAVLHALDGMENKLSPGLLKREKKHRAFIQYMVWNPILLSGLKMLSESQQTYEQMSFIMVMWVKTCYWQHSNHNTSTSSMYDNKREQMRCIAQHAWGGVTQYVHLSFSCETSRSIILKPNPYNHLVKDVL